MSIPRPRSPEFDDFDAMFRANVAVARRYATHLAGPVLAEDVVSEAFAVVWRRRERLPEAEDEQRAWVLGVVRNCAMAMARGERRRRTDGAQAPARTAGDHADAVVGRDRALRMLASLPPQEGEAMFLAIWVGMVPEDAARTVGCSTGAFRKRLTRARQHLATALADESVVEGVDRAR